MNREEILLYEKYSAFDHGLWDREEWLTLMNYSQGIDQDHIDDLTQYGYSFIQDAYYALRGNTPNDSLLGQIWTKVIGVSDYQTLPPLLTNINQTVTTVRWLADKVRAEYSRLIVTQDKDDLLNPVDPNDPPYIPDAPELGDQGDLQGMLNVDACLWALFDGTPKDKRALADATNKFFDLKGLTKFLGWAKSTVGGASRMGKSIAGQLTGYKGGGWSSNVHPREMLDLAKGSPMAKINMMENNLTTRQYKTQQPEGRGGVILLRDVSGSMLEQDMYDTTRLQTSVSIEVALALAFNADNRDLISILWSSRTCRKYTYGEPGWKDHVSFKPYASDSTLIDKALSEAINTAAKYAPNSDICILTDGFLDNHATSLDYERFTKILEPFRERGGKVWAIIMAPNATMDQLKCWDWVDGYITTESLDNTEKMTSIIEAMAKPRGNEETKRLI